MKKIIPNYDEGMWKGAPSSSFEKARLLRKNETNAEKLLWEKLKSSQLEGLKFRRQHPVNLFIADFYCHKIKLIIELDGGYHDYIEQKQKDDDRTEILNNNELKIIRFRNEDVENNIDYVLNEIKNKVLELKNFQP